MMLTCRVDVSRIHTQHAKCRERREFIFKMVTCNCFLSFRVFEGSLEILDMPIIRHYRQVDKSLESGELLDA